MHDQLAAAFGLLPIYLSQHVLLISSALGIAIMLSLPVAFVVSTRPKARLIVLSLARLVQTIPGLALIALFYPLLLILSELTRAWFGFGLPTLGFLPALLALVTFAFLPIVQSAVLGLTGIDPDVAEAADAVGMTRRDRLLLVDAPLSAPVVMAGIRIAAVWTIGAATLATPIGQPSLGNYIFSGLQTENWVFVLFGCLAAASLAVFVDGLLALIERGVSRRQLVPAAAGLVGLLVGLTMALGSTSQRADAYTVGAKSFSEQFILAELIARRLRTQELPVALRTGLGSAVIFRALAAGDVDIYVDYSGTIWTNVMGRSDMPDRTKMIDEITEWMREEHGVRVLGSLGFENAYGFVMKRERAEELGIRMIEDLARHAPQLVLGTDLEFLARPEWISARDAYDLTFSSSRTFNPTLMYRALQNGEVDVISGFTSDGRIAAFELVTLEDPARALPPYDALLFVTREHANDPSVIRALKPLVNAIDVKQMRAANFMVDREADKLTPGAAAIELEKLARIPPSPK